MDEALDLAKTGLSTFGCFNVRSRFDRDPFAFFANQGLPSQDHVQLQQQMLEVHDKQQVLKNRRAPEDKALQWLTLTLLYVICE